jgi:iron complex outermembrane recepter protein
VYNPRVEDQFSSDLTQASAFVRGSLFEMPAGDLSVVVGGEWRREAVHVEARALNIALTQDRDVKAGFVEARVPLVAPSMGVPLLQSVAITLAGRYDDYSDFGNTTNPQYGLEWNLVQDLLLRASYGDAYRAPSLFELYQTPTVLTLPTPDPRRNNQITNVPLTLGGNANLLPEESKTLSAGFVYTPEALRGFRTAVTYWRIKQDQRLQRPNQLTLIANEAFFPNRVVRDAPTPADIAAGLPGRLLSIDASNLNAGSLDTHGVDLEFSSTWKGRFGTFQPTLMATRVMKYDAQDFPGSPLVDRLGAANTQGAIPKTRATAGVTWTFKGFGLSPTVRYISSYDDVSTLNVKSGTRVDSQTLVDLQATLDFGAAFDENVVTKGLKLRLGVLNLTDQDAPFALVGGAQGYDPSEADLRRRFAYMTLEKSF